jgi:hypothetical protein
MSLQRRFLIMQRLNENLGEVQVGLTGKIYVTSMTPRPKSRCKAPDIPKSWSK